MRRPGVGVARRVGFRGIGGNLPPVPFIVLSEGTFVRASAAWWVNASGSIVKEFASGEMVVPAPGWGSFSGAMTNLAPYTERVGAWTKAGSPNPTTVQDDTTDPEGGPDGDLIEFGNGAGSRMERNFAQNPGLGNDVRLSVFARSKGTGDDDEFSFFWTRSDGTYLESAGKDASQAAWGRHFFTDTNSSGGSGNSKIQFRSGQSGKTGDVWFWGAMAQEDIADFDGVYVHTPVITAVTKAVDQLTIPAASIPDAFYTEGFWLKVRPYFDSAAHSADGATKRILRHKTTGNSSIFFRGSSFTDITIRSPAAAVDHTCTWAENAEITIVIDWSAQVARFAGLLTGNGTVDISALVGDWDTEDGEDLYVGHNVVASQSLWADMTDIYPLSSSPI